MRKEVDARLPYVKVLGVRISTADTDTLLRFITQSIEDQACRTILSGNVHALNLSYEQPWLRDYLNQADAVRLDGAGVRLGARLLGHSTPARITWADFAWDLAEHCAQHGHRLFFLGSKPGIAENAVRVLRSKYPALQVVGVHHGYFDKTPASSDTRAVIEMVNQSGADILVIGFGMPLQERWLSGNRADISVPVVMTGGAVFDYVSGTLRRPPRVFTDYGMEWLGRLLIEPRRLWRRYLVGNPIFLWRLLTQELFTGRKRA